MNIFKKLRKGVRAGMAAIKEKTYMDNDDIVGKVREWNASKKRQAMIKGDNYYKCENDIYKKAQPTDAQGNVISYKANNKLAHAKYRNQVDEKVSYLFTRDYTIQCDDETYVKRLNDVLGKKFRNRLKHLGIEASNKGIAWLQVYIDEAGKLKFLQIPSEQLIPVWTDNEHSELDSMIRVYESTEWQGLDKIYKTNVELWTKEGVTYYTLDTDKGLLTYNYNRSNDIDNGGPVAHYKRNNEWVSWGKVPFIAFKNNMIEQSDLIKIKSLLDAYDNSRSETANFTEDVKNIIYVLKGYGGQDLDKFMEMLNKYRAIKIDDPDEGGGVDTLTPTADITALKEHYEQLKRDITEDGQSINKDLDKFGSAPSGVALKFMYAGLDLKCNDMEDEFKVAFEQLLYFVNIFLGENGETATDKDVDIIFNRDMEINETEVIQNCAASQGIISDETIIANHPWTKKVEDEQARLKEQEEANKPFNIINNKVPIKNEGVEDGKEE